MPKGVYVRSSSIWNKGKKVGPHSKDRKDKISKALKGKKKNISEQGKRNLAENARRVLKNHPEIHAIGGLAASKENILFQKGHPLINGGNTGKEFNKQSKEKSSLSHKGIPSKKKGILLSKEVKERVRQGVLKTYKEKPEIKQVLREKRLKQSFPTKDTRIEVLLQEELRVRNIDFIPHPVIEYFQPDIFIPSLNTIVFADGCYWHACPKHYPDSKWGKQDASHTSFLKNRGYKVFRFWEHEILVSASNCISKIMKT